MIDPRRVAVDLDRAAFGVVTLDGDAWLSVISFG